MDKKGEDRKRKGSVLRKVRENTGTKTDDRNRKS